MNVIFNLLIPVSVMASLNGYIYRAMRRFRSSEARIFRRSQHREAHAKTAAAAAGAHSPVLAAQQAGDGEGMRRVGGNEKEMKKRDAKYTRASVAMVLVYLFCNSPRLVPNFYEIFYGAPQFPDVRERGRGTFAGGNAFAFVPL